IRLGHLVEDNSLVVDGRTGAVLHWSEPEARLYPLNTDVSTLAFTLWLLRREATLDEELSRGRMQVLGEPLGPHAQLAATMIQVLSSVDRTGSAADADWHYWTDMLRDEAGGVL
ncbi:MAG: hypothetical protein HOV82_24750, partial [Streptomyces sp.]|nr:hypothetical protein [Streptomyces sp.]